MICWLLASLATAAPTIPHERYELANGLDVILAPDSSDPIVSVNVWYDVGSGDEKPGRTGFAHLFEHLMFQGSPSSPGEYFDPLEKVGAEVQGSTTTDRTNYYETLPAEHLPLALFLESDRMGWLLDGIDQAKLDNQREVVRNERRQRVESDPYGEAWEDVDAALYPEAHPYHHPTIGSHEDLVAASLDDVKAFFRSWYVPNNAALVVAGAFDPAIVKPMIEEYFGAIPKGAEAPAVGPQPATLAATARVVKVKDVPSPRVYVAWPTPPAFAPEEADLILAADVLSGGRESRLDQALVHQGKLATQVTAFVDSGRRASKLMVIATAAPGHTTDELVAVIQRSVAELATTKPPTAAEIEAARAQHELGVLSSLETVEARADLLNQYRQLLGTPDGLAKDLGRLEGRTPAQVQAAAKQWLTGPHVEVHYTSKQTAKDPNRPGFFERLLWGPEGAPTPTEES